MVGNILCFPYEFLDRNFVFRGFMGWGGDSVGKAYCTGMGKDPSSDLQNPQKFRGSSRKHICFFCKTEDRDRRIPRSLRAIYSGVGSCDQETLPLQNFWGIRGVRSTEFRNRRSETKTVNALKGSWRWVEGHSLTGQPFPGPLSRSVQPRGTAQE